MAKDLILTRLLAAKDILHVCDNMRRADVTEIWALSRRSPLVAVMQSIKATDRVWVAKAPDGEPFSIFGTVAPVLGDTAVPWMIGTDRVAELSRGLMRVSRDYVRATLTLYPKLRNYVHDENEPSKRYLTALGFTLSDPFDWPTGARVREFTMERFDV